MLEDNSLNSAEDTDKKIEAEAAKPAFQRIVGVRFRPCDKIYPFDAKDIAVSAGTRVVADSEMGVRLGRVVKTEIAPEEAEDVMPLLRIATEEDIEAYNNNRLLEKEAREFCMEKAREHNLQMKVIATEATLDKKRIIFYFTADGRVDFRGLVRDLASKFRTRIEMRQIGVRDEVKLLGGFGICGRQTCCSLFLTSFEPVSIRMAKKQDLVLNPGKLSGVCGRLMCCLGYEWKQPAGAKREPIEESALEEAREEPLIAAGAEEAVDASVTLHTEPPKNLEEKVKKPEEKPVESGTGGRRHYGKRHRRGNEPQQGEQKEKGMPFSKRKNFYKKKKH
ncbi:MAG: stage 0 sporulation protein [Nitrospirae bacterium]|nr:stage 0 sporulation protein [Nitrospirota bacterium]